MLYLLSQSLKEGLLKASIRFIQTDPSLTSETGIYGSELGLGDYEKMT